MANLCMSGDPALLTRVLDADGHKCHRNQSALGQLLHWRPSASRPQSVMTLQSASTCTATTPRCGASTSPPCSRLWLWCSTCKWHSCVLVTWCNCSVRVQSRLLHLLACSSLVVDDLCHVQLAHVCGAGSVALCMRPCIGRLDYIHLRHSNRPHRRLGDPQGWRHTLSGSYVARLLLVRQTTMLPLARPSVRPVEDAKGVECPPPANVCTM